MNNKFLNSKMIARVAILAAFAAILMLFEFPIPFIAPDFYKLDFSEVPVILGGFMMGPFAATIIELIKIILNFVLNGTITAGVGETANFLIGCSMVIPAAAIFKKSKSKKGAICGLLLGTVCMILVAAILNYYVLLPVYSKAFHMPLEAFVDVGHAVNPAIVDLRGFVLLAVIPFNLLKGVVISSISFALYLRLKKVISKY